VSASRSTMGAGVMSSSSSGEALRYEQCRATAPRSAIAPEFASWFKALAAATRVQILFLLANRGTPTNVGEIVAAVDIGQSTVSAHLKVLAEVRFVLADHRGTATCYRINDACVDCFPNAAGIVMGNPAPVPSCPAT
jgi:predicted transcriptional regulator